jgi:hypothetical protein
VPLKKSSNGYKIFCLSSDNFQVYVGDTASHKYKEAEIARSFLNHPLRRIREWASYEIDSCQSEAKYWQQIDEESKIS